MYIKLLNEAVLEEKGEKLPERKECKIDIPLDAYLPDTYIYSSAGRMEMYKKIALIASEEDLSAVTDELVDRFGEPPLPTRNLLRIALIHSLAVKCRITSIRQDGGEIHIYPQKLELDVWMQLSDLFGRLRVIMSGEPHICLRLQKGDDTLTLIHKMFKKYMEIVNQKA